MKLRSMNQPERRLFAKRINSGGQRSESHRTPDTFNSLQMMSIGNAPVAYENSEKRSTIGL